MGQENTPSTPMEALIAELLGDVGRLHDEVKRLDENLPETMRQASEALEQQTAALLAASAGIDDLIKEKAQLAIRQAVTSQQKEVQVLVDKVMGSTVLKTQAAIDDVTKATNELAGATRMHNWKLGEYFLALLIAACLGSFITVVLLLQTHILK